VIWPHFEVYMKAIFWEKIDRLGMTVSFICAIHCIAFPLLLPLLPFIAGSFFWSSGFEGIVVCTSFSIASLALFRGYFLHRRAWVPLAFGVAVVLLLVGHESHDHGGASHFEAEHFVLASLAGVFLVIGHFLNIRFCRSCPVCRSSESESCSTRH